MSSFLGEADERGPVPKLGSSHGLPCQGLAFPLIETPLRSDFLELIALTDRFNLRAIKIRSIFASSNARSCASSSGVHGWPVGRGPILMYGLVQASSKMMMKNADQPDWLRRIISEKIRRDALDLVSQAQKLPLPFGGHGPFGAV